MGGATLGFCTRCGRAITREALIGPRTGARSITLAGSGKGWVYTIWLCGAHRNDPITDADVTKAREVEARILGWFGGGDRGA